MGSPYRLLTPGDAQPKLAKRPPRYRGRPILSVAHHLIPGAFDGVELCGARTIVCTQGCLGWEGRAGIGLVREGDTVKKGNTVTAARERRSALLIADPEAYTEALTVDIAKLVRYAIQAGARPVCRPNATSDLDWRSIVGRDGTSIFERFPNVRFYDYTKHADRYEAFMRGELPPNYHLTFSRAETLANRLAAMRILAAGGNVAALFGIPKGEALPATWNGYRVIDGRSHDYRFLDPAGVVVGLSPLGRRMKNDWTGFVIRDWEENP